MKVTTAESRPRATQAGDDELVNRFLRDRSEEAFAQLVQRHGPMVLGVCRSVLGNSAAAEDAAQATFLTLARKAAALRSHRTLVGWLYRVAWHISLRSAKAAAIRRRHEEESARMKPERSADMDVPAEELQAALKELPEKYRIALLLHHVEGRTEAETAALLSCSTSAVSMRLSRGREMLRARLVRKGITASALALPVSLHKKLTASLPRAFVPASTKMAASVLMGEVVATATVAALSKGAMNMLWITPLKMVTVLSVLTIAWSAGVYVATSFAAAPGAGVAPVAAVPGGSAPDGAAKTKGLHFVSGPPNGAEVIMKFMKPLNWPASMGDIATLEVGPAVPRWALNPDDIAAGKGLEKVYHLRAREVPEDMVYSYVLLNGGKVVGTADLIHLAGKEPTEGGIGVPGTAPRIMTSVGKLADMQEVKEGSFEVRTLSLGAIVGSGQTEVLWLKALDGGKDLIYPMTNERGIMAAAPGVNIPGWQAKLYLPEEFLKITKPLAQAAIERNQGMMARGPATKFVTDTSSLATGVGEVERTKRSLANASTNNHGGYIELARADLANAAAELEKAAAFFKEHPELAGTPAELSDASKNALDRILEKSFPVQNNQENLVMTLASMKTLAKVLRDAPGGTLDGNRDRAIANLERSFDNLSTAFDFLAKGGIPRAGTEPTKAP